MSIHAALLFDHTAPLGACAFPHSESSWKLFEVEIIFTPADERRLKEKLQPVEELELNPE